MSPPKLVQPILIVLAVGIALPILGSLASVSFVPNWRLPHEPLHSVIEGWAVSLLHLVRNPSD